MFERKDIGEIKIVSIKISTYITYARQNVEKTALCVGIEKEGSGLHYAVQLVIDDNTEVTGDKFSFFHHGRVVIGNMGSRKISEL